MNQVSENKGCLACDKPVKGRSDKKFCDDYCRNQYNNQLKSSGKKVFRNINNALIRNRNLLAGLIPPHKENLITSKENLVKKGFVFKYFTHTYTNWEGSTYHYCYDFGYLALQDESYLVVRSKKE